MPNDKNDKNVKYGFEHQDLETLHLINKKVAKERALKNLNKTCGIFETKKKNSGDAGAMRKLEEDMDTLKVETVNKSISKVIREQRTKLGLKQKDLANKVNVTPSVIQQYENGSIKSDIKVLIKLERVLKCKLTGKGFTK